MNFFKFDNILSEKGKKLRLSCLQSLHTGQFLVFYLREFLFISSIFRLQHLLGCSYTYYLKKDVIAKINITNKVWFCSEILVLQEFQSFYIVHQCNHPEVQANSHGVNSNETQNVEGLLRIFVIVSVNIEQSHNVSEPFCRK